VSMDRKWLMKIKSLPFGPCLLFTSWRIVTPPDVYGKIGHIIFLSKNYSFNYELQWLLLNLLLKEPVFISFSRYSFIRNSIGALVTWTRLNFGCWGKFLQKNICIKLNISISGQGLQLCFCTCHVFSLLWNTFNMIMIPIFQNFCQGCDSSFWSLFRNTLHKNCFDKTEWRVRLIPYLSDGRSVVEFQLKTMVEKLPFTNQHYIVP